LKDNEKKSDRIKQMRLELGLSQAAFAQKLDMSLRNYQAYEWGQFDKTDSVKSEKVFNDAHKIFKELMQEIAKEPATIYKTTLEKTVPVYDIQAQASNVDSFDDELADAPKSHVKVPGFEDCTLAVYVWNHSMYPTYENGCMVIVKEIKDKSFIQYGSVYLVITNEQRVVKRIYEDDDDPEMLLMASDNPELRKDQKPKYPTYKMRKSLIKRLFLVKGTIKRTEI